MNQLEFVNAIEQEYARIITNIETMPLNVENSGDITFMFTNIKAVIEILEKDQNTPLCVKEVWDIARSRIADFIIDNKSDFRKHTKDQKFSEFVGDEALLELQELLAPRKKRFLN